MANYLQDPSGALQGVALANYFEHLSGVLQIFGATGIALLIGPVLITLLARDVPRVLLTLANEGARQFRGLEGR